MILDQIVANSRHELETKKSLLPQHEIQKEALKQPPPLDFASALRGESIRLIAEVKKASPSKGVIRPDFNPVDIARIYADNGAAAISVLTETKYFQGSLNYLKGIKDALRDRLPVLRKDFIFDPYQVYEARAYGADALLLIVAILRDDLLKQLLQLSHTLAMSCLVEVHSKAELKIALDCGARVIGINNRDLYTFTTDIGITQRLRPLVPLDRIVVSESGIMKHNDIEKLRQWGVDAVLIGEAFMSAPDIAKKMLELV